jgi:mRNA deadenylase 3'-5' endonuclease subunit Ccr4
LFELEIKVMHWNILAQKLTNNDYMPNSGDPWLDWRHRSKLIK